MGVKYSVDNEFFTKWTIEMAYTLGFWYADGSVEFAPSMRGRYIRVACTDKQIIESIRFFMRSEHSITESHRGNTYKPMYLLRIGSATLFDQLKALGIQERKSKSIHLPLIPDRFMSHFVRGYFDGDGCIYLEKSNAGRYKRMTSVFTSGSTMFLHQLCQKLHTHANMTAKKKIIRTQGGFTHAYQLRYSTRDSMKLYQFMYPKKLNKRLFLWRKRDSFEIYLRERGVTEDNFMKVLSSRGPVRT